ncbi:hypothetical protein [Nocardiopsis dassonvillei]|uniref:hypothetical protein n=1 Tax=Nocardiopsis dassonvillei TaxID=2014 RepID=UPI003632D308
MTLRGNRVRTTTCPRTGKRRYNREYDATRELRRIHAQLAREGKRAPREAYECPECDGWHLTSSKRRAPLVDAQEPTNRPGSRERRRRWRAALTFELLLRCPTCQVAAPDCTGRAVDIVPLDQPDLRNPGAWVTACGPCRDATLTQEGQTCSDS